MCKGAASAVYCEGFSSSGVWWVRQQQFVVGTAAAVCTGTAALMCKGTAAAVCQGTAAAVCKGAAAAVCKGTAAAVYCEGFSSSGVWWEMQQFFEVGAAAAAVCPKQADFGGLLIT